MPEPELPLAHGHLGFQVRRSFHLRAPSLSLSLSLALSLSLSRTQSPETRHLIPVDRGAIARDLRDSIIPVGLLLPVKVVGAAVPTRNDGDLGTSTTRESSKKKAIA